MRASKGAKIAATTSIPSPDTIVKKQKALPPLDSPLPAPPALVKAEPQLLAAWNFANSLYLEISTVKIEEIQRRKKVLRAIAPPLLLALKHIDWRCFSHMKAICPMVADFEKMPAGNARKEWWQEEQKTPVGKAVMHWVRLSGLANSRFERWTLDTRRAQPTRADPNNNHCILELIKRYQVGGQKLWWIPMAMEHGGLLLRQMIHWQKNCSSNLQTIPVQSLLRENNELFSWRYLENIHQLLVVATTNGPTGAEGYVNGKALQANLSIVRHTISELDGTRTQEKYC